MVRVWIASAVVVAVVVTLILVLTHEPVPDGNGARRSPPPRDETPTMPAQLSETEVRTYMKVRPVEDRLLREAASAYPRRIDIVPALETELARHNYTRSDWDLSRKRVEYVVDVIRYEESKPTRIARLDADIAKKRELLERATGDDLKKKLRADIETLESQKTREAPPIRAEDRDLVKRFWKTLDGLIPRVGSPQKR